MTGLILNEGGLRYDDEFVKHKMLTRLVTCILLDITCWLRRGVNACRAELNAGAFEQPECWISTLLIQLNPRR